jgi:hypothetical protein
MKRTDYRDVAKDLAQALGMNYVFGVEFFEVDRLGDLGLQQIQLEDPDLTQQLREELRPDPARYLGLHGSAILSRYAGFIDTEMAAARSGPNLPPAQVAARALEESSRGSITYWPMNAPGRFMMP